VKKTVTKCNKLYPADILIFTRQAGGTGTNIGTEREVMLYNGIPGQQHVNDNAQQQLYGY
jgi:hypothetical protein